MKDSIDKKKIELFYDGVIIVQTLCRNDANKSNIVIKEIGTNGLYYVDDWDGWKNEEELKFIADMIRFKIPVQRRE